jgi:hypothetical protein
MRSRIRIAAVGLVVMTLLCAVSSSAAAQSATSSGGFVHTGEHWPGTAPIFSMVDAGLAGMLLVGRRRIVSLVRSLSSSDRRRDGS